MSAAHTATPWSYARIDEESAEWTACEIEGGGDFVSTMVCKEEDADFICRACNAHDDLMFIARTIAKFDEKEGLSPTALGYLIDRSLNAIAKARGAA